MEQVQVVMLVLVLGNGFTVVSNKYIYIYLKSESSEHISLRIMTLKGCFKRQFIFYFVCSFVCVRAFVSLLCCFFFPFSFRIGTSSFLSCHPKTMVFLKPDFFSNVGRASR